jgi:hypothetical protein
VHELLLNPKNDTGVVEYFPAHPHEGAVGVPEGENHANVIGRSPLARTVQHRFPENLQLLHFLTGMIR